MTPKARRKTLLLLLPAALLLLLAASAWGFGNLSGQSGQGSGGAAPEPIRGIALMELEEQNLFPGGAARAGLIIGVNPGFHLNSDKPTLDWVSPTKIEFEAHPGLKVTRVSFPEPKMVRLPFADEPLPVFEKMVPVALTIEVTPSAPAGPTVLKGVLSYQACDDKVCLPPAKKEFAFELTVLPAGAEGREAAPGGAAPSGEEATGQGQTQEQTPGPKQEQATGATPETAQGGGQKALWLILLTTFLGGLALNLTPCVYPLIPITVAYFGGQSRSRLHLAGHGGAYLAGIAATYTTLGTFAALSGGLMGEALQHPLTLLLVAGVLLLLAASMLGFYEFRLPARLNRLGGAGAGKKGLLGSLFMGLTLGLVAAPCIGPFTLGVLTFVAQRGDPLTGAAVFLALSLGLGLPLAVLGFFSSKLVGALPTSGSWMEWVRRLLGAVLIFMAVYLLRPLLGETVWPWAAGGSLLLGAFLALFSGKGVHFLVRLALALAFAGVAFFQVYGQIQTEKVHWPPYSPAALEQARAQGRPVVLDFSADWCAPCRILAENLADERVASLSARVVALSVDLTDWESSREVELRKSFDIRGVPTLIFIGSDGQERRELRTVGAADPEFLEKRFKALLGEDG